LPAKLRRRCHGGGQDCAQPPPHQHRHRATAARRVIQAGQPGLGALVAPLDHRRLGAPGPLGGLRLWSPTPNADPQCALLPVPRPFRPFHGPLPKTTSVLPPSPRSPKTTRGVSTRQVPGPVDRRPGRWARLFEQELSADMLREARDFCDFQVLESAVKLCQPTPAACGRYLARWRLPADQTGVVVPSRAEK
jgi:hypothetical protein